MWGPGVRDRVQAFHYVDDRIADSIRGLQRPAETLHVVDLGCGVGGSLCYLAERLPIRGTGITLSPVQVQMASQRIRAAGLSDRVVCLEGDYGNVPAGIGPVDLAYAIESFAHAPSPARFFAECSRIIKPGGVLAICDDFRRPTGDPAAARAIERFCEGWHLNTVLLSEDVRALGREAGFDHESTVDLSPYLELGRPRDRAIDGLVGLFGWFPLEGTWLHHLLGGTALQTCLKKGWIGYELAVFRRG